MHAQARDQYQCLRQSLSTFIFGDRVFHRTWNSLIWLNWMKNKLQGSTCFFSCHRSRLPCVAFYMGSRLHDNHFIYWDISPILFIYWFFWDEVLLGNSNLPEIYCVWLQTPSDHPALSTEGGITGLHYHARYKSLHACLPALECRFIRMWSVPVLYTVNL